MTFEQNRKYVKGMLEASFPNKSELDKITSGYLDTKADKTAVAEYNTLSKSYEDLTKNLSPCWIRIAEFTATASGMYMGGFANGCELIIRKSYGGSEAETHRLILDSGWQRSRFMSLSNDSLNEANCGFKKIRHVVDNGKAYIDVYWGFTNNTNSVQLTISNGLNATEYWKPVDIPVVVNTLPTDIYSEYDIPSSSELAQREVVLWSGEHTLTNTSTDITVSTDVLDNNSGYYKFKVLIAFKNGNTYLLQPIQEFDIGYLINVGDIEYTAFSGYDINISNISGNKRAFRFELVSHPTVQTYTPVVLEILAINK